MVLLADSFDYLISLLTFFIGFSVILSVAKFLKTNLVLSGLLYIWHSLFAFVYATYSLTYVADSSKYFSYSKVGLIEFDIGTGFIYYISSLLSSKLHLPYFGHFLFYSFLGSIGLVLLLKVLTDLNYFNRRSIRNIIISILFLPSLSFWTVAIGKEPIAFLSISLFLWSCLKIKGRSIGFFTSILLMLSVRPHMAGMLIISFFAGVISSKKTFTNPLQLFLVLLLLPVAYVAVSFGIEYAGIGMSGISINQVSAYIETRQSYNMSGGGGINISELTIPAQVFTYMFRPLPYEAHSITSFISSIDNLILLMISFYGIRYFKVKFCNLFFIRVFMFYCFLGLYLLSTTTANLGISVRQKWMVMPIFLFLILFFISKKVKVSVH